MSSQIDLIRPKNLNGKNISSWFTLRNPNLDDNQNIDGLNLGLNTQEESAVVERNRRLLLKEIGIQPDKVVFGNQVHQTDIEFVEKGGTYADTDAFVTDVRGLALAIQVADCAAILLGDEVNGVIGAAHAGWRGAVGNIVPKTIQRMREIGAEVKHLKVFVSPCISFQQFEVGEEVAGQFPDEFVDREQFEKPHVDLKAFLNKQLVDAGISSSNIEIDKGCTITDKNFYSYRRQKDESGRMMGIIMLKE